MGEGLKWQGVQEWSNGAVMVALTLQFWREDGVWIGECVELGTATDAEALETLLNTLPELVTIHLNGLEDIGEREQVFREYGIMVTPLPSAGVVAAGEDARQTDTEREQHLPLGLPLSAAATTWATAA